jgi:hypothetical protein
MSSANVVPRRYDLFGWYYESVNALTEAEAAWHLTWARRRMPDCP